MRVEKNTVANTTDGLSQRNVVEVQIRAIGLCLGQLEREARECGLELSAELIRVASLSLQYAPKGK